MAGVAIQEVVLAPVSFVGNDDDIASISQQRVGITLLIRSELLDGSEDDAARGTFQELPHLGSTARLLWRLWQDARRGEDLTEELVIQVISVGDEHNGRIGKLLSSHGLGGVKQHLEALARTLGVPDNPSTTVPIWTRRLNRRLDRCVDCPVLVVLRHPFDDAFGFIREDDEVAKQVQEACWLEDPTDEHLEWGLVGNDTPALNGLPRCIVLEASGE